MHSLLALRRLPAAGRLSRRRALQSALGAVGGLIGGLTVGPTASAATETSECSVKAAYLYQFLSYVEWPPEAFDGRDAPLVVGLFGADAVLADFERVAGGRRVNGRPLQVRRLAAGEPPDGVHLLFLGRSAPTTGPAVWALGGRPVLVVTDLPSGLPEFGALNFVTVDQKIRFEASQRNAERAGLKLSSRLLLLAERRLP